MPKPVIFTISASWDDEAYGLERALRGHPAAADAPNSRRTVGKMSAMRSTCSRQPSQIDPGCLFLQITALRVAVPAAALMAPQFAGHLG